MLRKWGFFILGWVLIAGGGWLAHSVQTTNGVTIQVFRPSGRPEYATSTAKASWRQS